MSVKRLVAMGLLTAIGTLAGVFSIPVAGAMIFPVQHAINVLAAVLLGPGPAVLVAFAVALLRNLLGTGTVLAFPGGMIGAFVAGYAFRFFKRDYAAAVGEVFGTGILGALAAVPLARLVLGSEAIAFVFVIPFATSSLAGAVLGLVVLKGVAVAAPKQLGEEGK
ncbi:energy coupling factor transporter S component ThiW [Dethiobacter alkaliphilus]|uniref:ThiW protein n=1 Tax=Dethiobacter alkaliphilus AHT 1 TaxID=555088 RepID=C0GCU2_DETAL|nr:energy coupling factor transporter S component ThiW [Dethiobacter alkaliphilus]EEG79027.1 thiW protein [Dethiobacter alkaliphilus AHT 1]